MIRPRLFLFILLLAFVSVECFAQSPVDLSSGEPSQAQGWVLLTDQTASHLTTNSKQYLYLYPNRWYMSPQTNLVWNWTHGQQLTGTYEFWDGTRLRTSICVGSSEVPALGVGCSNGSGEYLKVLTGTPSDPAKAIVTVCETLHVLSGSCELVTIYVREVIGPIVKISKPAHRVVHYKQVRQQAVTDNVGFDRLDPFSAIRIGAALNPTPAPGAIIPASQLHIPGKALKEYQRSQKAFHSGNLTSSANHLQKAIEIYPQFVSAHNALGLRYVQFRQYEKAIGEHQSSVALSPSDGEAHADLSLDLLLLNRYAEAEAEARRALELDPRASGPRYVLGRALIAQLEVTPEAMRMLKETENTFPNASLVLAQLHFALGNADETINDLRHYLRAPADDHNQHKAECWLARLTSATPDAGCSDVPGRPSFK